MTIAMDNTERQLWQAFVNDRSTANRNALVEQYMPLVVKHARGVQKRIFATVPLGDLIACGVIGLMNSITTYDPERGISFATYCALRVRGEMLDDVREMDWVPRTARQRQRRINEDRAHAEQEQGRRITTTTAEPTSLISIEAHSRDDNESLYQIADRWAGTPYDDLQHENLWETLKKSLDQRSRRILMLRFVDGLRMRQIAEVIGISESRIHQQIRQIIDHLRERFADREYDFVTAS